MPFKLIIGNKGKSWKSEITNESIVGKSVGERINGKDMLPDFEGYEFEITGGTDLSGFPLSKNVEGIALKRLLLKKGWGMKTNPRGIKKKRKKLFSGLKLRKTVRGKQISGTTAQINVKILMEGSKKLEDIFPEQNVSKQSEKKEEVSTA